MKHIAILCLVILFLFGCNKTSDNNHVGNTVNTLILGKDLIIKKGETLINNDLGLRLTLDTVVNDSRCPDTTSGITCVWEGDAEAKFDFTHPQGLFPISLHSNLIPKDTALQGYKIKLISINPYPMTADPIDPEQYNCVIRVD